MGYPTSTDLKFSYYFTFFMTVLVKFQIEIVFSIELHGNSKLLMMLCPPSSDCKGRNTPKISRGIWASGFKIKLRVLKCFSWPFVVFLISFTNQVLKLANIFKGYLSFFVLTFCRPSPNFKGNWPKGPSGITGGGGGGGQGEEWPNHPTPPDFWPGNFCWPIGKREMG